MNIRELSSVFAYKGRLVSINVYLAIAESVRIVLLLLLGYVIKITLVYRIFIFFYYTLFEIFGVNPYLYFA